MNHRPASITEAGSFFGLIPMDKPIRDKLLWKWLSGALQRIYWTPTSIYRDSSSSTVFHDPHRFLPLAADPKSASALGLISRSYNLMMSQSPTVATLAGAV
jgi:hypothetical protein